MCPGSLETIASGQEDNETVISNGSFIRDDDLACDFLGDETQHQEMLAFFADIVKLGLEFKSSTKARSAPTTAPSTKSFPSIPIHGVSYKELLEVWREIAKA